MRPEANTVAWREPLNEWGAWILIERLRTAGLQSPLRARRWT
jgi:hypothetical protein